MKRALQSTLIATALIGGSTMAFQDTMDDYPRNIARQHVEPSQTRATVNADLVRYQAWSHLDMEGLNYPAVYVDTAGPDHPYSRAQVRQDLDQAVGGHFREGVHTASPGPG